MLPPDNAQGTAGAGQQPTPSGEGPRPPAGGDIGTDMAGHAEPGAGADGTAGAGRGGRSDATEAGTGSVSGGSGAITDGNGAAAEPSTMTLAAPAAGEAGVKAGGQGIAGGRGRWSTLSATGRALSRAAAAGGAGVAAALGRTRRTKQASVPGDQPAKIRSADIAGTVLARLTVLPAVLVLAWLIPGVPLLLAGHFRPIPVTLISVSLAAAIMVIGLRVVPASWPRLMSGRTTEPGWTLWFGLLATVAVVAGLTGWQLTESSQAVIVLRDQGTYLQTGYWIAQHGSLPIPQTLSAFGPFHAGLNFASTGFGVRGTSIYPAVLPGLPLLLAGGFWVHGITGALATGPLLGGLATLTFAGLVGRLVGPQWAPAGALILGLSLPQQYVGRTSLSETALQIMIFGGLCLMADSLALRGTGPVPAVRTADAPETRSARARLAIAWQLAAPPRWPSWLTPQRVLAALAGLVLSFGLVISLDALVCLLVVIPFSAVLLAGRRPQAAPFLSGLVVGLCYGILCLYLLDRPLLDTVGHTVALAGLAAVVLAAASIVAFQLPRVGWVRRAVPRALARWPLRWLPEAGALLVVAALIGFVVRPYVQKVHGHPGPGVYHAIKALQQLDSLQIDPTRTYAEQTLYWVIWYVGLPTVLLGAFALAVVVRRCLRALLTWRDPTGVWRIWGLPLAMICAGSVAALWAPDIVPDQPWASRRLIVIAIPGLILSALWAAAWLGRRARDRGARPVTAAVAGLFCAAAMLVPTVSTTFGVGLSHSSKTGALKPVVRGLALTRSGAGQVGAVSQLCASIPRNVSVVIIDYPTGQEFSQVIRGMCGVPVAWMADQPVSAVESVIGAIAAAGRQPLLIAGSERQLLSFGGSPVRVLDLATSQDPRDLTQLPTSLQPVRYQIWMTEPVPAGSGT
ncbi:MAG TPA: hypothetical protein VK836_01235 [Streptosporangiaceae bacterium]|nr:hypothetical protein [Streptosporangiaceae bacterium]